ncbi:aspartyl-phosphate phosphatase Spo0E family protein [Anaerobacillus sp. HL2]|nr:aspartyl-phosphate phosphatase Spo0E family protein [Anaerobacillus sp. HL2]
MSIRKLELKINILRRQMISTAKLKGFNHPDTIKKSRIRFVLNEFQHANSIKQKIDIS